MTNESTSPTPSTFNYILQSGERHFSPILNAFRRYQFFRKIHVTTYQSTDKKSYNVNSSWFLCHEFYVLEPETTYRYFYRIIPNGI